MSEIIKINITKLDSFTNHPFQVKKDDSLNELIESIKSNGLLNPIVVREKSNGRYEIVSGHRRKYACELLGNDTIDCIVKDMSDEEAIIQMVDSNIYREKILPSEKAFAYKMKLDAIKHQGKTLSPKGTKNHSVSEIKDTKTQVYRFVRLTYLISELLKLVDETILLGKKARLTMGLKPAVELSYLTKEEQLLVYETIKYTNATPSHAQAIKIRELSKNKQITFDSLENIISQKKGNQNDTISFNKDKIERSLPLELVQRDKRYIEKYIIEAIEYYNEYQKELKISKL